MTARRTIPTARRAFTLMELVAAMIVLGLSVGTIAPLMVTMSNVSERAARRAEARYALHLALDRISRFIREIPEAADGGAPAIVSLDAQSITLESTAAIAFSGSTITLTDSSGDDAPLCDTVDSFQLAFIQADGVTPTTDPTLVHRVHIIVERDGMTFATVAFLRISEVAE